MISGFAIAIRQRLLAPRPMPVKVLFIAAAFHLAPFSFVILLPFAIAPTLLRLGNLFHRAFAA